MTEPGPGRWRAAIGRIFAPRQVLVRGGDSVRAYTLGRGTLIGLALLGGGVLLWASGATLGGLILEARLDRQGAELVEARLAYAQLRERIAEGQRRFGEISREMEATQGTLLDMADNNAELRSQLHQVSAQLADTEREKRTIATIRATMAEQLAELEAEMEGISDRNRTLRRELSSVEQMIAVLRNERDAASRRADVAERDGTARIQALETQLSVKAQVLAELQAVQRDTLDRIGQVTSTTIDDFKAVVQLTDIPTDTLLSATGLAPGEDVGVGGLFEPSAPMDAALEGLYADIAAVESDLGEMVRLRDLIKRLPLGSPAESFYVSSRFGKRRDPFNKRWALHSGVDLSGPLKSPIYATAPGVVTFAGTKGGLGKMVEIAHGNGISTRYGHLFSFKVKKGQSVGFREKIALMGSSGRSTGSHLHYEVLINGTAVNPSKFMEAGRYVLKERKG